MMKEELYILMIDDHPMIIEGYKNTLLGADLKGYALNIDTAPSSSDALRKIRKSANSKPYDMVLLDIKLPPCPLNKITSGEDLTKYIKQIIPSAKIVILTMYNENHRIHGILKSVNPDGFLVKSDLTSQELVHAFISVLNGTPHYSKTVMRHLRKQITANIVLDDVNRNILFHLSEGVKTKNLTHYVNLSLSAIEKRKAQLKDLFDLENGRTENLVAEAKKRGYV